MKPLYQWKLADPDPDITTHLANKLELPRPLARALVNRGVNSPELADRFMNPDASGLHDPFLMHDMEAAVARVLRAIDTHERILVIGDYDVDGITGAALLVSFLEANGGHVRYYIPERETEGYGLSEDMVRKAGGAGYGLIITVDCGISCNREADLAASLGIDLIVTDHHEQPAEIPNAVAVLDPKRADTVYPFRELAGVGVVFKLVTAIGARRGIGLEELLNRYSELVALGTVSDLVPLLDENRFFAKDGLPRMAKSRNLGIFSLLEVANIRSGENIETHHISFGLAPRINAAGRVWRPRAGVELLLATSPERARLIAKKLDEHNRRRITEEASIFDTAVDALDSHESKPNDRVILLFNEDWQIGIIGIVASRLLEKHHRPVILTTLSKNPDDIKRVDPKKGRLCQGSGRSVPGFDLFRALSECTDILVTFGGHALAAGLKIYEADIPRLRERLNAIASVQLGDNLPHPTIDIDAEIPLSAANMELLRQSRRMNPFGAGNPQPLFATNGVSVLQCRAVGESSRHLQLRVGQASSVLDVIGFGFCDHCTPDQVVDEQIDIAYFLKEDNYSGRTRVKLHLKDLRASRPS